MTRTLTPAQHRGLAALAAVHPRSAVRAAETRIDRGNPLHTSVQYQVADWLVAQGLIYTTAGGRLTFTIGGVDLCEELGLRVAKP